MISSSIATAKPLSGNEPEEMFAIASEEASRLVRLTSEFLTYARPRPLQLAPASVDDTLLYVVDAGRAHVSQRNVQIQLNFPQHLAMNVDAGQVQQALINLIMNAADSALPGSTILLNAHPHDHKICIDVENSGDAIREQDLARIFELFFTTKPKRTGLGLAIARGIARAHGGDLALSANGPKRICFSLLLPLSEDAEAGS
jgi:signal transduction histidine kinase